MKLLSVAVSAAPEVDTAGLQLMAGQAVTAQQAQFLQRECACCGVGGSPPCTCFWFHGDRWLHEQQGSSLAPNYQHSVPPQHARSAAALHLLIHPALVCDASTTWLFPSSFAPCSRCRKAGVVQPAGRADACPCGGPPAPQPEARAVGCAACHRRFQIAAAGSSWRRQCSRCLSLCLLMWRMPAQLQPEHGPAAGAAAGLDSRCGAALPASTHCPPGVLPLPVLCTFAGVRNHRSGHVEDANLSSFSFDEQYHTFQRWEAAGGRACVAVWLCV